MLQRELRALLEMKGGVCSLLSFHRNVICVEGALNAAMCSKPEIYRLYVARTKPGGRIAGVSVKEVMTTESMITQVKFS